MMCANLMNLQSDIEALKTNEVEFLHVDVMDGHFVDNLTLGIDVCIQMKKYAIPRDIHMLVYQPFKYVQRLELMPKDIFQCHVESKDDFRKIAEEVHRLGAKFGLVLNPATDIEKIETWLDCVDIVTLMMIQPGFAGQPLEEGTLEKITYVRNWLDKKKHSDILIEVDGHVSPEYAVQMSGNGANLFVAGTSSIFRKDISIEQGVKKLRKAIAL